MTTASACIALLLLLLLLLLLVLLLLLLKISFSFSIHNSILHFDISYRNLVSKYEAGHSVISSSLLEDMEEAVTLLLQHASPLVGEMTKDNQLVLFGKRPLLVVYYDINWDSEIKKGEVTMAAVHSWCI